MIISCPACKKKFEIDANLIPKDGRNLKCGSCLNVWFYRFEKKTSDLEIGANTTELNKDDNEIIIKEDRKEEISTIKKKIVKIKRQSFSQYEKKQS